MKITITTIEASAEELRANRNLSDVLMDALSRACDAVARPVAEAEEVMAESEQEGGDT